MARASKLALLLATPFSIIHRPSLFRLHRRCPTLSLRPLSTAPHRLSSQSLLPVSASSQEFHNHPSYGNTVRDADYFSGQPFTPVNAAAASSFHPWPEWSKLVDTLYAAGYLDRPVVNPDDGFVEYGGLPDEFVRAATACLAFARDRPDILGLLSRRDMETLAENGTPFLFQNAADAERRMRSFLFGTGPSYVVESDRAQTVDLIKYIVTYASNPIPSGGNNIRNPELTEASVRCLLSELADMSCRAPDSDMHAPEQYQNSGRYGQARILGPKIEMKRGDWICPRCSFMNFARNLKCLDCEEYRPKRQLTGGEWECPQCDYHNYGRNRACLRCDCERPGDAMFSKANSSQALGYNNGDYTSKAAFDGRLTANEEKAQRWFGKVSQQDSPDSNDLTADEHFPEIMPLRKGVNRFVVSTRKTPLDRRITNSQNQNNLGDYGTPEGKGATDSSSAHSRLGSPYESPRGSNSNYVPFVPLPADMFAKRTQPSTSGDGKKVVMKSSDPISSKVNNEAGNANSCKGDYGTPESKGATDSSSTHSRLASSYESPRGSNSNYVPFVPLPADMFGKRTQSSTSEDGKEVVMKSSDPISSKVYNEASNVNSRKEFVRTEDNFQISEKPSIKAGMQIDENEQEDGTGRWFKRVAELHDISDLASAVSDEDFPEIMPMRKGDNRFVISKKKDRSMTSPAYKRQESVEQGSNTNFVPFVPFPADYFAKKDKQQLGSIDSKVEPANVTSPNHTSYEKSGNSMPAMNDMIEVPRKETPQTSTQAQFSGDNGGPPSPNQYSSSIDSQSNGSNSWNTCAQNTASQTSNSGGNPHRPPESQNVRSGWTGKSLEGSAVKEPDPLDMSEEAKAERWFRRVAQIKDISELSQIPDEDFPSIMPMRKGVNRFVVSKRKTPLERRLTSAQYRKNLPIVNSNPIKKENESS